MNAAISTVDRAIEAHRAGHLGAAIMLYEQALKSVPDAPAGILHLAGMAYLGIGKPGKASPLLGRAAAGSNRPDFHFGHGNALYALKRHRQAAEAFETAARLDPSNSAVWFNLGNAARAARNYDTAIRAFNRVLDDDPLMTTALANLATAMIEGRRYSDFADLLQRVHGLGIWNGNLHEVALLGIPSAAEAGEPGMVVLERLQALARVDPQDGRLFWLIGNFQFMQRDFDAAEAAYARADAAIDGLVGAKRGLALLLAAKGEMKKATKLMREAAKLDPETAQAINLANLFIRLSNRSPESIGAFGALSRVYPESREVFENNLSWLLSTNDNKGMVELLERRLRVDESVENLINLGACLMNLKRDAEATRVLRRTTELEPKTFAGWYNLCSVLMNQGRNQEAFEAGRRAFKLDPRNPRTPLNLATIAGRLGDQAESERILRRGLKYNPGNAELITLLGNARLRRGDMKGALKYFEEARASIKSPAEASSFAMQLMAVNYSAEVPAEIVADMHFKWGDAIVASHASHARPHPAPARMKRRLRVGYVSGDYKNHSCAHFAGPLIASHDPAKVEVYCYMTEHTSDAMTQRFRQMVPHWREVADLTDPAFADLVRRDRIDILVDMSGHTSGSRLPTFAIKPAPIQVNWLGYPNTTGLPTMDYRFTDESADPVGTTEHLHRETLFRLPHFLCYQPPESTPPVGALPCARNGYVTFGCFNNSNKITDEVVALWAKIMKRVPGSHIVLKTGNMADQLTLEAFRRKFERNGIEGGRVECFVSFPSKYDHLMTYSDIDLALDPFPYNGTTTTFECLWMGVPMIVLAGEVHAARVGLSIMKGAGLPELAAASRQDYLEKAVALAQDVTRIARYRETLRGQLENSPMMDAKGFAHGVEAAYFSMWNNAVQQTRAFAIAGAPRKDRP